jgi:hypothetical protein
VVGHVQGGSTLSATLHVDSLMFKGNAPDAHVESHVMSGGSSRVLAAQSALHRIGNNKNAVKST